MTKKIKNFRPYIAKVDDGSTNYEWIHETGVLVYQ